MSITKRILIACIHYPVASGRYIAMALRRMGYDVRTTGPTTGNRIWGIEVDARYTWKPDEPEEGWTPDLIITADSAYTIPDRPDWTCPHILWGQDNHASDYRLREWDAMFLCHTWGARMNEPNAYWLPPCYDPSMCYDAGLTRDIDVTLIGYPYQERIELAEAFQAGGLKTHFGMGAVYDEYREIYNRTKIALNWSHGDITNRIFEAAAMGCCVLTNPCHDLDKMGLCPGVELWTYIDTPGAIRSAQQLIETGNWQKVAQAGRQAGAPHTWDNRAAFVLETMGAKSQ
ncbi:MAG TPA: glycosyltransferase [Anaerolineae bacterium]